MLVVKQKVEVSIPPKNIVYKLINGCIFKHNYQPQNNLDYQPLKVA